MTIATGCRVFLRQTAYAVVVLAVVLTVMERLTPGSVLPFLDLFWVVVLAGVLSFLTAITGVE